jgi:alpha-beta hydrolase superfamily lysophospholipase
MKPARTAVPWRTLVQVLLLERRHLELERHHRAFDAVPVVVPDASDDAAVLLRRDFPPAALFTHLDPARATCIPKTHLEHESLPARDLVPPRPSSV